MTPHFKSELREAAREIGVIVIVVLLIGLLVVAITMQTQP